MRKAQKKQVEDFIVLLGEAQKEVKNAIRNKNVSLALDLLEQCQQGAIRVGTLIDQLEGEGHPTVTLLEEYCELVYKLHEELANGSLKAGADAAMYAERVLTASWKQINTSVEQDIPARIEVVFCPYKASMWDSLESVWKAADEDPNCDAYVIPIPYFDKNTDGSFAEEHYEGLEYPEYVPITYYKSYNFEERKPDMVFIHNPYDEFNFVTSVHPFYYASNLVKYTDKLVYIPYFINLDDVPEHFCLSSGTKYADLVTVQSEKVKDTYIRMFKKYEETKGCQNIYGKPEEKFLALGSPKTDKAVTALREQCEIPKFWQTMCKNKKGERKKIVFLNTTLVYILKYEKQYLDHLKEVFDVFKMQEDVLLLWRPHPLADATFSSMRRDLYEDYIQLIEYYKTNNIGIYDDSPDPYCAISLCDACYGDNSSVLVLVWAQKKPIMYRNMVSTFQVNDAQNGIFADAIYNNKGGIKKMLMFETQKYSLEHFLYDIQCKERYDLMMHFVETQFDDIAKENYTNFGCAGKEIYIAAKERLLEEE